MNNLLKSPKRLFLSIILIGLLVVAFSASKKQRVDEKLMSVVAKGNVFETVTSSGSVEAAGISEIYSPTVGIIKNIFIVDGQQVKKGQPLFEVTSTATEAEKSAALSDLLSARVALKKAENDKNTLQNSLESGRRSILEVENTKKIFDEYVLAQKPNPATGRAYTEEEKLAMLSTVETTRKSFSNLEKQYTDATESIKSAQAALNEANIAYKQTQDSIVKSPIDGRVTNLKKAVSNSVDTEKRVMIVKSSEDLLVEIKVSEFNIAKIKKGQTAKITIDALPGEEISGKVLGLDEVGNESLGTVSYDVSILLTPQTNQAEKIFPAMTANISIVTNQKENTLTVPRSALKVDSGKYFVSKSDKKKQTVVEVVPGLIGTDNAEILEGLYPNDKVLTIFEEAK